MAQVMHWIVLHDKDGFPEREQRGQNVEGSEMHIMQLCVFFKVTPVRLVTLIETDTKIAHRVDLLICIPNCFN